MPNPLKMSVHQPYKIILPKVQVAKTIYWKISHTNQKKGQQHKIARVKKVKATEMDKKENIEGSKD